MNASYVSYLRISCVSEVTIKNYCYWIEKCLNDIRKEDKDITIADIVGFLGKNANSSSATKHLIISSLKSYFSALKKLGAISENPTDELDLPKVHSKEKAALDHKTILSIVENLATLRDKAMVVLMCSTGLRFSEVLSIKKEDYFKSREIIIVGKGGKSRTIYINDNVKSYIDAYYNVLSKKLRDNPYLFVSYDGGVLKNNSFNRSLKRAAKKAGILNYEEISAHWMRHAAANFWSAQGVPVADISKALGHSSLSVTTRYLHTTQDTVNNIMNKSVTF